MVAGGWYQVVAGARAEESAARTPSDLEVGGLLSCSGADSSTQEAMEGGCVEA